MLILARAAPGGPQLMHNVIWTSTMNVHEAIREAEALLPGKEAPEGATDPRWQAIIQVGEFIQTNPEEVWAFTDRWGRHEDDDLRSAVATCLLEHLLQWHFDHLFPLVEQSTRSDRKFADTLSRCWKLGEASEQENSDRIARLLEAVAR